MPRQTASDWLTRMGRPIKSGLDYFPLDTKNDDKLDLIEAKFGIQGYGIIIKLWSRIYRGEGYYTPWTEREQLLFSKEINVDINTVETCLMYAIKIGLFDCAMYRKGVLTSKGIQKRFIEASKRRHEITFYSDLLLVNVDIIPVNVSNKPRSLCFNVYAGTHIEIEIEIENEIETKMKEDNTTAPLVAEVPEPSKAVTVKPKQTALYHAIRQCFLAKTPTFANYAKEALAIKRIEAFAGRYSPDDRESATLSLIAKYWELVQSQDKFWHKQPFTPAGLGSLMDRVARELEINRPQTQEEYEESYAAAREVPF